MPLGLWVVVGWMAFVALSAVAMIVWGFRSGQFKDIEGPKYRMLEDREPQSWPRRESKGGGADA
ncbi:MAG: cbb3-type cytochrome oxidase assembly protein CcoS [Actinobacteria bacterium]|nr:MAG: cbb3-type cytochrome oxidase assembly protein CcoS [Actinomycetota bacterium]